MAYKATGESYLQVSHEITTVFISNTSHGIGMVQADPTIKAKDTPMFLHSNILKWGLQELFGQVEEDGGQLIAMKNGNSVVEKHLQEHRRIFGVGPFFDRNIDPEPVIWKVLERVACWSVMGNAHTCRHVRMHMEKTFGYKFPCVTEDRAGNAQRQSCAKGPWYGPSRAKRKPETWTSDSEYEDSY